jgi:tetratricopeptide (TPR) repeat protein
MRPPTPRALSPRALVAWRPRCVAARVAASITRAAAVISLLFTLLLARTALAEGAPTSWATRRAAELTASGQRLMAAGAREDALVAFREAISMDPTYGPAFLDLAAAREAAGDANEAERVLSMALERIPDYPEARERRATLRERRGDGSGAADDLELAVEDRPADLALHARLVDACIRSGALPRALAAARRWVAAALASGDAASSKRATQTATALAMVVDRADPVSSSEGRGEVRGLLGAWAKRLHASAAPKVRGGR